MFNIQKTQEEIVKDEMREIDLISKAGLENLKQANESAYRLFWHNEKVTPQEFCDLLGNEAYKLFQASAKSQQFLSEMNSTHTPLTIPEDKEVKFNNDGTVVITDKPLAEDNSPNE